MHGVLVDENQLDEWVRGNSRIAQGKIVELIWRLVAVSTPYPKERRFPLEDSIGQPGPDGYLITEYSFEPFVPEGLSYWEIGTGNHAGAKATLDFTELTAAIPQEVRKQATFVFVTPLSGRRDWQHTWKLEAQASWIQSRRAANEWADVRVIDGTKLIDWLRHFPAVESWLAEQMNIPSLYIQTSEQHWNDLRTIGDPPPLTPEVFLLNRGEACKKLDELFAGNMTQLKVDTLLPDQVADFVTAYIASLEEDAKLDISGKCLVISNTDAWNVMTTLRNAHILVANFDLDDTEVGTKLLERAKRGRHSVIFSGRPGGIPHPNRVTIPNPKSYQIKDALEKAGYNEERARNIAQRSDGNLSSMLRCVQHLSLMPEWAQGTEAAELAIAEMLGSWSEQCEEDKAAIEKILGNSYGDWVGVIRDISLRPGSPLITREGNWKVVMRYEGWFALGPRIFEEHLKHFKDVAIEVLTEIDPKFELDEELRHISAIYNKTLKNSELLRKGIAETLALLGSYPEALVSCKTGLAESIARNSVREILADANWLLWASLKDLLPLLAEAAPDEFLEAVEHSITSPTNPFDKLFLQEGKGLTGWNYMSGLLWALETLAWDERYLTRVIVVLGELSIRDPGGTWSNRPSSSLSTILLPWFPQTTASMRVRRTALETLLREVPKVAWYLLLDLLPSGQQTSSGSHKPSWRKWIPDDWSSKTTFHEYMLQVETYAELTLRVALSDISKLTVFIGRLADLPKPTADQLLEYLNSDELLGLTEVDRLKVWNELTQLITKHRKYAEAQWALSHDILNKLVMISKRVAPIAPTHLYQRLFNDYESNLFEEVGNYEEQRKKIEENRKTAIIEIYSYGGVDSILEFAKSVEQPLFVGISSGLIMEGDIQSKVIPLLIESDDKAYSQFVAGYVWGAFRANGWPWVDQLNMTEWTLTQISQLLAYLPFHAETWERVNKLLGNYQEKYWLKANVNPYEAETNLEWAIDRLIEFNRPSSAIRCLDKLLHENVTINSSQAFRVLKSVLQNKDSSQSLDVYHIVEIIKVLQADENCDKNELAQIEWSFLPVLDRYNQASPKQLERQLANDPAFYCQVISIVFRSKYEGQCKEEVSEEKSNIATNAYRLLQTWKTPPGMDQQGLFHGDVLVKWAEEVKQLATESGHLEVAYSMVGKVLVYTPADPNGLWIHESAAMLLNDKDSKKMREGFQIELFNSRGVYSSSGGKEERQLAARYKQQADDIEIRGYHRLAGTLRQLASSYENEAIREEKDDPFYE